MQTLIKMNIGEKIKKAREEKGFSMDKLAGIAGLAGRNTIYKYEAGKTLPSLDALEKIAKALDLELKVDFVEKA